MPLQTTESLTTAILADTSLSSLVTNLSIIKACWFLTGQLDRNSGKSVRCANGSYLDGWHYPAKTTPPSLSDADWLIVSQTPEFTTLLTNIL